MATPVTGDKDHGGSSRILNLPPPASPEEPLRLADYSRVNPNWLINGDFSLNSSGLGAWADQGLGPADGWWVEGSKPLSDSGVFFTSIPGTGLLGEYLYEGGISYSKFAVIQWLPPADARRLVTRDVTLSVTMSGTGYYTTSPVRIGLVEFVGESGAHPGSLINRRSLVYNWFMGSSTWPGLDSGCDWIGYDVFLPSGENTLSVSFPVPLGTSDNVAVVILCNSLQAQHLDTFTLRGVKLELGTEATPMEPEPTHSIRSHAEGGLGGRWFTGATTFGMTAKPPPGWILSEGTIGPPGSGATRANIDTMNLYGVLWHDFSDTYAPVAGGRGSSALADWSAGKTISVPDARGRFLAGEDGAGGLALANRITVAGSGINSTIHGGFGGDETHLLTANESGLRAHTHGYVDRYRGTNNNFANGSAQRPGGPVETPTYTTNANSALNAAVAHNNVPPVLFLPLFVKL